MRKSLQTQETVSKPFLVFPFGIRVKKKMDEDEAEWETAADNFQVLSKLNIRKHDDDEWESSANEFSISAVEIKSQVAGE